jgi:tetratricopeptide (TPR) repeat protein
LAWVGLPPQDFMPRAKAAALKAIEIDPALADAHTSLANALWLHEWNWAAAEREFTRAIELNPNSAGAHSAYASFLTASGRFDEAAPRHARALELDPLSHWINAVAAVCSHFAGDPDRALAQAKKAIELEPKSLWGHVFAGNAYEQKGMLAEAIAEQRRGSPSALVHVLVKAGRKAEAAAIVERFSAVAAKQYVPPFVLAYMFTGIGDEDRAFASFDDAVAERSPLLVYLNVDPAWDSLRQEPRFAALVERVGAPRTPGRGRN